MSRIPDGENGDINSVLTRNIGALRDKQNEDQRNASLQERLAESITRFTGSMAFVYIHLVLVGLWIAINLGIVPGVPVFDPTFVILATFASVEAIFLSTFVLISQNRAAAMAERRAELDLQTSLLAEYEITRALSLTIAIAKHLGVEEANDPSLQELRNYVAPEKVLEEIEQPPEEASTLQEG
ncbi:DUF1003 domain-containing protein [Terrihabitans rhizophilus]|jgi:uncharacterized membrane protein|uniref:DUF1003 domain-containing protein n=1 Tax=Terrihabitans rhizophilus TaxID=3092662 RepID=A0ABU4RKT6_9HYPH|nr:DUF1003 domain-containing protein [Terrihabitans sp. PJ23]MDX6805446.1 DUF1003 domain-containing protein [Terrihabitans sp. PJ23]